MSVVIMCGICEDKVSTTFGHSHFLCDDPDCEFIDEIRHRNGMPPYPSVEVTRPYDRWQEVGF